jgi:hypothetical protein
MTAPKATAAIWRRTSNRVEHAAGSSPAPRNQWKAPDSARFLWYQRPGGWP